jgi:hypothetical protein
LEVKGLKRNNKDFLYYAKEPRKCFTLCDADLKLI